MTYKIFSFISFTHCSNLINLCNKIHQFAQFEIRLAMLFIAQISAGIKLPFNTLSLESATNIDPVFKILM